MHDQMIKPGIYRNMPGAQYAAIDAARSTQLKTIYSDSVARSLVGGGDSESLRFGRACHSAILEPEVFEKEYRKAPSKEDYPGALDTIPELKAALKEEGEKVSGAKPELIKRLLEAKPDALIWENICKELDKDKREVVTSSDMEKIEAMRDVLMREGTDTQQLLSMPADRELTAIAKDPDTGLLCKARLDFASLQHGIWADLKTTKSANVKSFVKDAMNMSYDLSVAFHCDVLEWAMEQSGQSFNGWNGKFWVAIEKIPPHFASMIEIPEIMVEKGREKYRAALAKLKEHKHGGDAYTGAMISAQDVENLLPGWY